MARKKETHELFHTAHLMILISYTLFAVILIGESLLLGWETWVLFLIGLSVIGGWVMHILGILTDDQRQWLNSAMMMACFFFYGIHQTSTFDLAVVMAAVIMMYTMTGNKLLITFCQITYYVTMTYELMQLAKDGTPFDALFVTRSLLHLGMIFMIGWFSRTIIDKWTQVLSSTHREIEHLTDAGNRLNDFLANVSHELRTPINAVVGLTGICIDKEQNEEILSDLRSVQSAGQRVSEQISDILDYSEIDRGKLARNEEDYMLASVLSDLVTELRPHKSAAVELVIDVDPAIPSVLHTDVSKLRKILRHLLMNGLKYTRTGGVYVRISAIPQTYGVNLFIEVEDTGIGMTEEETERIFDRFYQVDSGRSRSVSGLGLGLAIVSGFVASLGGFITLTSKSGVGTKVCVSLPQRVIDPSGCMSVRRREQFCLGAYLRFERFEDPNVREYYNNMVRNMVGGLGVQMHRVENAENLKKLLRTVRLSHLFVSEYEYRSDPALIEKIAARIIVIVIADADFMLPHGSKARIMYKPFYCFPVAAVLNQDPDETGDVTYHLRCDGVQALVVDDELMNLTVARSILKRYGIQVTTAHSGHEAIALCRTRRFDIVFMDHMMPEMDGIEAMKRIRADGIRTGGDTPIVMLTANAVSTAKETFLAEGFDGFVSKPIELRELERVLQRVLPKSLVSYDAEKITPAETEEELQLPSGQDMTWLDALRLAGVDVATGLDYCQNDEEFYRSLLLQFASEAAVKRADMEKFFSLKDYKNYEILVHALKSTSMMIGCSTLSEQARSLEFAAKEQRFAYIESHHAEVMTLYDRLTETICAAADPDQDSGVMQFLPEQNRSSADDEILIFAPEGEE
ncbi:MAG: response regulator [Oscillospiraceae bacterium]|nr:response regulator [Oscillospiraceae bacterium]